MFIFKNSLACSNPVYAFSISILAPVSVPKINNKLVERTPFNCGTEDRKCNGTGTSGKLNPVHSITDRELKKVPKMKHLLKNCLHKI